ncbi:MAG: hypothetical protein WCD81_10810 [Candidatus Bathyarchaeia archaeon]
MKLNWKNGRIVGYVLLAVGVAVIFFAVFEMILVFTGSNGPPKLFNFSDISVNGTLVVSGKDMNRATGLLVWFVLMAFVMWGGGKIGSLGVNLLREIKVELKGALKTVEEKEPAKTEPAKTEPAKTEPKKEP